MEENKKKALTILGNVFFITVAVIIAVLWMVVGFKCALLTFSLLNLLMYINIAITTLGNAFIGRNIDMNYDMFWKILFILMSAIGFGIYFTI